MKEGTQMTPKEKTGNVIKGPWAKRKVKPLDEEALARREDMAFADDLCQTLLIQMIHTMDDNNIDVGQKSFAQDMSLIIELTKGCIYRDMSLEHPIHKMVESLVEMSEEEDNNFTAEIKEDAVQKFIDMMESEDDDGPEIP